MPPTGSQPVRAATSDQRPATRGAAASKAAAATPHARASRPSRAIDGRCRCRAACRSPSRAPARSRPARRYSARVRRAGRRPGACRAATRPKSNRTARPTHVDVLHQHRAIESELGAAARGGAAICPSIVADAGAGRGQRQQQAPPTRRRRSAAARRARRRSRYRARLIASLRCVVAAGVTASVSTLHITGGRVSAGGQVDQPRAGADVTRAAPRSRGSAGSRRRSAAPR